jgi:hypothetical protein
LARDCYVTYLYLAVHGWDIYKTDNARNTKKIYKATLHQKLPTARWKVDARKKGTGIGDSSAQYGWIKQRKWGAAYPSLLMQPLKNNVPFAKKSVNCCRNHFNFASLSKLHL